MCGISGFYSNSNFSTNQIIRKMNNIISHRGPDFSGIWQDDTVGIALGHQRLSIIDTSAAGNQPMQSNSGQLILTYNGEIYNHIDIRKDLDNIKSNIKWRGNSDTETLLEAIDFWGIEKTLQKIDGMFAFGLWNQKTRSLIIARDRIGEKPIYYGWQGKGENKVFLFGSELKVLKIHPEFNREIDRNSIALQLRHNCIPAPYTVYKDIYKLLPGNYLELRDEDLKRKKLPISKKYWSLTEKANYGNNNQLRLGKLDIQRDLENILKKTIKKQMISDVPLGAFLSGGIDSSTVVALMQSQSSNPIKTFTIGFNEDSYSEAHHAKKIAKHLGTNHTELYVSSKNAMDVIPKLPTMYDEPFSDSSQISTFLVSQLARQHVKVAVSGDGGDELFCGYNRYAFSNKMEKIFNLIPFKLRKVLSFGLKLLSHQNWNKISKSLPGLNQYSNFGDKVYKGANALEVRKLQDLYYNICSHWQNPTDVIVNSNEPGTFLTEFKPELKGLNVQQQMMILDTITYLPDDILVKIDRAAMSTSLETRVPFLDHKLIEYVWQIPHSLKFRNGQGKWILREILNKYIPKNLTERPKMGFGIPIDTWLRGPLKEWAENLLNENRLKQEGYFNTKLIRSKWEEHISGKKNWQFDLWDILMFQAWLDENS